MSFNENMSLEFYAPWRAWSGYTCFPCSPEQIRLYVMAYLRDNMAARNLNSETRYRSLLKTQTQKNKKYSQNLLLGVSHKTRNAK